MRTAAKVFIWIGMIFGFYLIFPIIVGVFALKKLDGSTDLKEIHNFGIVTLFFCNFLGGLFMIAIDEKDCYDTHEPSSVVKYETSEMTKEEQYTLNGGTVAKASRVCIYLFAMLVATCFILGLSILALINVHYTYTWSGSTRIVYPYKYDFWIIFLPATLQILFGAVPIIMYFYDKKWISRKCNIALISCIPLYAAAFATTVVGICYMGNNILFTMIVLIVALLLVLNIALVILNRKILYTKRKNKVVISTLEYKLREMDKLLENGVITQSEYAKMREKIIAEYY